MFGDLLEYGGGGGGWIHIFFRHKGDKGGQNSVFMFFISKACLIFSNSAVKVHDSQACKNNEMTREHISFTFDLTNLLLSRQISFHFVRAAVACAILERDFGFETTASKYLKHVTVPSLCSLILISLWMPLVLDRIQWSIKPC